MIDLGRLLPFQQFPFLIHPYSKILSKIIVWYIAQIHYTQIFFFVCANLWVCDSFLQSITNCLRGRVNNKPSRRLVQRYPLYDKYWSYLDIEIIINNQHYQYVFISILEHKLRYYDLIIACQYQKNSVLIENSFQKQTLTSISTLMLQSTDPRLHPHSHIWLLHI